MYLPRSRYEQTPCKPERRCGARTVPSSPPFKRYSLLCGMLDERKLSIRPRLVFFFFCPSLSFHFFSNRRHAVLRSKYILRYSLDHFSNCFTPVSGKTSQTELKNRVPTRMFHLVNGTFYFLHRRKSSSSTKRYRRELN